MNQYLLNVLLIATVTIYVQAVDYSWGQAESATESSAIVEFGHLGQVSIKTSRPIFGYPTVIFTEVHGRVLLRTVIGADDRIFRINPEENGDDRENPVLRFSVIDGPAAKSKVVLVVAKHQGGSDCGYQGSVIGESQGRLRSLLRKQAFTNAEGGMYVGDLGKDRGYGFAVWNFIWGSESHMDPHRFNVKLFRLDPVAGQMVKIADLSTTSAYGTDTEALAELGLHYPNLLRSLPGFDC